MSTQLDKIKTFFYDDEEEDEEYMPNLEHAAIGANLVTYINVYAMERNLGRMFDSSVEYRFLVDKKPVPGRKPYRQPDASFIKQERLPANFKIYPEIVPDLAVEIVSPSDRLEDIQQKIALYQKYNVPLIWLVQPLIRSVGIYRLATKMLQQQIEIEGELEAEDIIPGFKLKLTKIFDFPATNLNEEIEEIISPQ